MQAQSTGPTHCDEIAFHGLLEYAAAVILRHRHVDDGVPFDVGLKKTVTAWQTHQLQSRFLTTKSN